MSLTINGIDAASMRWTAAWSGPWVAELELHHGDEVMPSGRVAIVSATGISLAGRVDPKLTGTFGEKRWARVVGGLGWTKSVRAQHYHSDIGLPLQVIASTTAAEAGEAVTVLLPKVVGVDFVRRAGPASQIFTDAEVDWWVGLDGVTRVGLRPPTPAPVSLEVLDWDPAAAAVTFTADVLVEPGTVIVDERFGRRLVREVEAIVSKGSVTGTLWVTDEALEAGSGSELVDALAELAREATRAAYGRLYEYRVIAMAGDRVELNIVAKHDGVPDVLPASVWAGISGYKATLTPASRVLVGFVAGNPTRPYVAAYEPPEADGWRPVKLELDAVGEVAIGAEALAIVLGGELATGVATQASQAAFVAALASFATAMEAFLNFAGVVAVSGSTAQPVAAAVAALAAAAALPSSYSVRVRAA